MNLILVLGDQLNRQISSLTDLDRRKDVVLICEVWEEAEYTNHHKKKLAFIFSAMRHFADELRAQGITVRYTKLQKTEKTSSFRSEVEKAIRELKPERIVVTEPSEYCVLNDIKSWAFDLPIEIRPDTRFLISKDEFSGWAKGRKQLRMEYFYRDVRRKYSILMEGDNPAGGQWNFDKQNRNPLKEKTNIPAPYVEAPDRITLEVIAMIDEYFGGNFGDLHPFYFAVTREQALKALDQFVLERLTNFGSYQDAMLQNEPWLYHSHLSFYLNCGLLLPVDCIRTAEEAYRSGQAPLNSVEGFIRQIAGWREFVRGIYWLTMPAYADANFLEAYRPLPSFFWTEDTQMNCLRQCIKETKENAYTHHIQRLMVIGNFSLLAALHPDDVNDWFLSVYADAYQWVELPNVTGMILFADGGVLASKPYAASGAYINRMSNYCKGCRYKVTKKNGPDACPFNYLYWNFLIRNDQKLRSNPRLRIAYQNLDRMSEDKTDAVKADSQRFFNALENEEKI
ncbi:MAG: cryptochrome/photolyase family protein [Sneathiellales bacterium]|nr:cryptochrome/photolyase family protein [Sneathiellales bacterium]